MAEPKTIQKDSSDSQKTPQEVRNKETEKQTQSEVTGSLEKGDSILLVEDEPLLGNLLEKRLKREDFNVFRAKDGEEALDLIQEKDLDLVLLDIILPKVSGFEFMEKVQESPRINDVPIVVISNLGQESDIQKGKELGAVGYFVKAQLSIEDLVSQVKEFLQQRNS